MISVGDILIVSVVKENREWGYNPAPDGTRLRVVGFNTQYYGRCGEFGRKPGQYIFNSDPIVVKEDDGTPVSIGNFHLRNEDGSTISIDWDGVWVGELPELPFWEGDLVKTNGRFFGQDEVVITRISYRDIHTKCNDGVTPYPIYTISPTMTSGASTAVKQSDLSLIERGNIWKYYHGEPLSFANIQEETNFYDWQIGRVEDVRNETIGLFSWTIEEAVNAVRNGQGDAIYIGGGMFGSKQRPNVKKFLDRDIGDRVREETLKGWLNFDPKNFASEIEEELKCREEYKSLLENAKAKAISSSNV